ncbi:hypothetical protein LZC95_50025 [Pendulispora brunnea]|uniref:Uncharacterized protein n=1 Tax=Pendulispora brunnea TaxID=2905690 RepID=A0ABZ2K792_9BACT
MNENSSIWEQTEALVKRREQEGGVFLRLADGEKAVVVFRGDPYAHDTYFKDSKEPTLRIALNVVLYSSRTAKIFEASPTVFKDICVWRQKYGLQYPFELQRSGTSLDTKYTIMPERQPLTEEEQRIFAAIPLLDLKKKEEEAAASNSGGKAPARAVDEPKALDPKVVQAMADDLRKLPRSMLDAFLAHFGIQRVKDLAPADFPRAQVRLKQLFAELAPPPPQADEVDPFA